MLRRRDVAREDDFRYGLAEAQEKANLMKAFLAEFDVVNFDECHHVPAPTFYLVAQSIPARFRFGYSATPDKDEGTELKLVGATGPAIYEETPAELIEGGYAVAPEIFMLEYDTDPALEALDHFAWSQEYQEGVVDNSRRNKLVQQAAHDLRELGHTTLVLVDRIDHGEHLERLLVDSQFLHGTSGMARRKKGLERLAARTLPIVIATSIFDEGIDVPAISCLINARGGKAEHRAIQSVGRGMRTAEGKDRLVVVDFYDAFSRRLRRHARARAGAYEGTEGFTFRRGPIDEMKKLWR
jgi:superfamily II DNA or RNA helicase